MAATLKAVADGFPGSDFIHQDQVVRGLHEGGAGQQLDLHLRSRRIGPVDPSQVPMHREACDLELVTQTPHLAVGELGIDQPVQLAACRT